MKTPNFWRTNNILSIVLKPFGILYYFLYKLRCSANVKPYKSKIPVVCVGNIITGGSGKTPIAIELANILKGKKKKFCFLSKGYGGKFSGVKEVDSDNARIFGDEPIILREYGDVFVSKNRVAGLKYINDLMDRDYDYIIIDDGLQNPTFYKNKSIVVVDGEYGLGNGNIFPSGPLREKFEDIVSKVSCVIIVGEDKHDIADLCRKNLVPFINGTIVIKNNDFLEEYVAFCGIGHPEKFKKTLATNAIYYTNFITFGDHYFYKREDIIALKNLGDKLITTKKDWVKLDEDFRKSIDYIDIKIDLNHNDFIKILRLYGV